MVGRVVDGVLAVSGQPGRRGIERDVSLCIDGAATKPVKFGVLDRTVLKGGHNI